MPPEADALWQQVNAGLAQMQPAPAPVPEDSPQPPAPDATDLWRRIKENIGVATAAETGVTVIKPTIVSTKARMDNPSSLGGRPQTPAELKAAKIYAAKDIEARVGKSEQFIKDYYETKGLADARPEEAAALGVDPNSVWENVKRGLGVIGRPALTAIDIIGTKLDAPAQAIYGGALSAMRGEDPIVGATTAFNKSAFQASNPERIWLSDVMKQAGVPEGPNSVKMAKAVSDYVNEHLGTSLHLQDITPDFNARSVAGLVGETLNPADPINHLHIGAASDALKLASGRSLNRIGETAYHAVESAHFLEGVERVSKIAEKEGAVVRGQAAARQIMSDAGVLQAVEKARPAIEAITKAETPAAADLLKHSATLKFARMKVEEMASKAVEDGNDGVLQLLTEAGKRADTKIDALLASSDAAKKRSGMLQAAMRGRVEPQLLEHFGGDAAKLEQMRPMLSEEIAKASKQLLAWEDTGGLRIGPLQVIPGKPVREAAGRMVAAGERVKPIGKLIDVARKVSEGVSRTFEPLWGTPKAFRRLVQEDLFGKTVGMHYRVNQTVKEVFKGVSVADRNLLTTAIDEGTVGALPEKLQIVAGNIESLLDDLFTRQVEKRHLKADDKIENYIYHYYKNERKAQEILAARNPFADRTISSMRDPSTYQREIPTLAEAKALGLEPEYDAAKLLTMRLINGEHQLIQHTFLEAAAAKFGLPQTITRSIDAGEEALAKSAEELNATINATLREGGAAMKEPLRTDELIRAGHVDLADPKNVEPIAYQLVKEGKTSVEALRMLPDPYKTEFMRWRLIKARGVPKEIANVEKKYEEFMRFAPKGEAGGRIANALDLPRPRPYDGPYVSGNIPRIGNVTLPKRVFEKMTELGKRETIWSEQGKPLQDMLRLYDKLLMNRFRVWNTAPNPAFHFRNAWNNLVQSGMDIGYGVLDPASRVDAIAMTRGARSHLITLKGGIRVSARDLEREFIDQGMYTSFLQRAQVNSPNAAIAAANEVVRETSPLHKITHAPFYYGSVAGEMIENDARRLHYLALRKDGIPAAQAAERVKKFLFDYQNDYTPMEREVLRRIIPFYGWASKNLELQVGQMVTNPKVLLNWWRVGQAMQRDEKDPMRPLVERSLMQSYMESQHGIRIGERNGGTVVRWLFGADLPLDQLNQLWAGNVGNTIERWTSQGGPTIEIVGALYDTLIGPGRQWRAGESDDARAYAVFGKLHDEMPVLTDWLGVRQEIDRRTGQNYWVADRAKMRAFMGVLLMAPVVGGAYDRPLRDLSRFIDPNKGDSGWSALAHYLTGGSFTDYAPGDEAAARAAQTMGDASQELSRQQDRLTIGIIKSGATPPQEPQQ
jgi:hypothetical protein